MAANSTNNVYVKTGSCVPAVKTSVFVASDIPIAQVTATSSIAAIADLRTMFFPSGLGGGSATIVAPQGRLTLQPHSPVMTTSYVSASTFYYDCYIGNQIPYYTGSADAMAVITSCELSDYMQMSGTGAMNADDVFDVFYVNGVLCIPTNGSGAGWSGDAGGSTGGRGTGYSAIHQTRGYWTNTNSISHCYNSTADNGPVFADQATYLSTFSSLGSSAGHISLTFVSIGGNPCLCFWNAYNRVPFTAKVGQSGVWSYDSAFWRSPNGSDLPIYVTTGLPQDWIATSYAVEAGGTSSTDNAVVGVDLDSNAALPNVVAGANAGSWPGYLYSIIASDVFAPVIGMHTFYAVEEYVGGVSQCWFYGAPNSQQVSQLMVRFAM